MTASIVINTYNRARHLERLLPSLAHLVGPAFEVVVVNGPSTDDTEAVLAAYDGRIKVASCREPNLSRSRNVGIAASAGDVVVFIDDDALPADEGWLRALVEVFARDTDGRIGAAGGPSIHADTEWREFSGGWTSDYAEQLFNDQPLPAGHEPARWVRRTIGNNSAFRRAALVAIGGFDENFPYYLDEADVCLRLVRAGYTIEHVETAVVRHYPADSPLGPPFIRNRRIIARSDTYYCLQNGADGTLRRVLRTFGLARRKHFVSELRGLVTAGRISEWMLWKLRWQLLVGFVQGCRIGLFGPRAARLTAAAPPAFLAFPTWEPVADRLSVALLSRRIPPDTGGGGVGRYTLDLALGLHALGHRVRILCESDAPIRRHALGLEIVGVRSGAMVRGLRSAPILEGNVAYASAVVERLDRLQRDGARIDVVHASTWGLEGLGVVQRGELPLALVLVTPLECVIDAEGWAPTADLQANIDLDQWTLEHATRVCAPSAGVVGSYEGRDGWTGRAVHTVPLGIVTGPAPAPRRDGGAAKRLLFVGRLERRKGIEPLLESLPALLETHPDWVCDLVGDCDVPSGPGETFASRFRARHEDAAWLDRVRFHGVVDDMALRAFYQRADLFVAPSLFESFGLIYLEAMQYGVPVVGCRTGGVPEVVADGDTGLLVPPGDTAALHDALDRLMSDSTLRATLGRRAAEAVHGTRTHVAMAARMTAQYREAMQAHAARGASRPSLEGVAARTSASLGRALHAPPDAQWHRTVFEAGERAEATALVIKALAVVAAKPAYQAAIVETALAEGRDEQALADAVEGFNATADESEACLVFAATLLRAPEARRPEPRGWSAWRRLQGRRLPKRLFEAGLTAIRDGRDATAAVLLEACRELAADDRALLPQVCYHLGSLQKRRGRAEEARATLAKALAPEAFRHLPHQYQSALHFHLGDLALRAGATREAIPHLEACLKLNPGHRQARALLGQATTAASAA